MKLTDELLLVTVPLLEDPEHQASCHYHLLILKLVVDALSKSWLCCSCLEGASVSGWTGCLEGKTLLSAVRCSTGEGQREQESLETVTDQRKRPARGEAVGRIFPAPGLSTWAEGISGN